LIVSNIQPKTLPESKKIKDTSLIANKKNIRKEEFQPLEIVDPQNNTVFDKPAANFEIKLPKNSLVVVQSPIKDFVFQSEKEKASFEFPLALGENVIVITVYPKDKKIPQQKKTIYLYYLKQKI
ncbi:MAG: hypothetical protein ACPL1D_01950, partial [Microgenomates group bacterium]